MTDRCDLPNCDRPAQVMKLVAAAGGLDPAHATVGLFCSDEHADRIPSPSKAAIANASAKLDLFLRTMRQQQVDHARAVAQRHRGRRRR